LHRVKILVATDGSRGSRAALAFAARLASRAQPATLVLLNVRPGPDGAAGVAQLRRKLAANSVLARKGAALRWRLRTVSARRSDEVPEAIAREADRWKADLVVVGSEGRDTLSEWIVGGVALRLIYVARRPVVVVRPPRRRRALPAR